MQPADGLALLATSFCAAYAYYYVRFEVPGSAPPRYLRLRDQLSIAAIGGCCLSYLAMTQKLAEAQSPQSLIQDGDEDELKRQLNRWDVCSRWYALS